MGARRLPPPLPVAPAVGDRPSIGDGRHGQQSGTPGRRCCETTCAVSTYPTLYATEGQLIVTISGRELETSAKRLRPARSGAEWLRPARSAGDRYTSSSRRRNPHRQVPARGGYEQRR